MVHRGTGGTGPGSKRGDPPSSRPLAPARAGAYKYVVRLHDHVSSRRTRSPGASFRGSATAAPRAAFPPRVSPQGRAHYAGERTLPSPAPVAVRRATRTTPAQLPGLGTGLNVARARVRDAPWDASHWSELADLLFRRGDFDLAAKAYRRVQEIYLETGPASTRGRHDRPRDGVPHRVTDGSSTSRITPPSPASRTPVPEPPLAPPSGELAPGPASSPPTAPGPTSLTPSAPTEAVPKVPILTSTTGQTRAIRLPGTNILVSVTGYAPSPSILPPPRRLRAKEEEVEGTFVLAPPPPSSSPSSSSGGSGRRPPSRAPPGGSDDNVREVLERDMQRFLRIFERAKPENGTRS